jgi:glucosamine--fructose-6-phosphate aminotransferase (isomerizing)
MRSLGNLPDPFLAEIRGQPDAIRRSAAGLGDAGADLARLAAVARERPAVVFTGMGASFAACFAPVSVLGGRGIAAVQVDAAELLHFRRPILRSEGVLVAVSQSGESAEVVTLVEELPGPARPLVVAVTNGAENRLARAAELVVDTRAGTEEGPSTATFAACLVSLAAIADVLSGAAPEAVVASIAARAEVAANAASRLVSDGEHHAVRLERSIRGRSVVAIVGRGTARAAAETGALVLKEAARVPAEAYGSGQFRHGPLELAGPEAAVAVVVTEPAALPLERRLAAELSAAGASVLGVATTRDPLASVGAVHAPLDDPALAPAVAVIPFQVLAWHLAVEQGRPPGRMMVATKVTTRE